jgi:hypothetical protein
MDRYREIVRVASAQISGVGIFYPGGRMRVIEPPPKMTKRTHFKQHHVQPPQQLTSKWDGLGFPPKSPNFVEIHLPGRMDWPLLRHSREAAGGQRPPRRSPKAGIHSRRLERKSYRPAYCDHRGHCGDDTRLPTKPGSPAKTKRTHFQEAYESEPAPSHYHNS